MLKTTKSGIIPEVSKITYNDSLFTLTEKSGIGISSDILMDKASLLRSYLAPATGFSLPISENTNNDINIQLEGTPKTENEGFPDESYSLIIEDKKCILKSWTKERLARAIQTLRQLLPPEILSQKTANSVKWEIPGCKIDDTPRFKWRGMHLDVCRHFMTREEVCRFIDLIALYKYNRFHFHLTDDQGWRIEIKKYPRLISVGSKRDSTVIGHFNEKPTRYDDKKHEGFYSQSDIKEIVAYASEREIVVVPEIDMPGHMQAAISAYPQLGCIETKIKPMSHWGISQHILNVEDSSISFMKDVISEVIDLFPGEYIHIGGDEAPKNEWKGQRRIQDRMIELGVKNEDELQSWFISQIASFIQSKGRNVIGWDEILEGGLAEGVAVMSWNGEKGGIEAAKLGHDVVMTPENYVYFDHYQGKKEKEPLAIGGYTSIKKVYNYEPIPKIMAKDLHKFVMGSQGQIWTEYMKDFKQVEYMAFPRVCALAEVLWTKKENKNYKSCLERIKIQKQKLDILKVNYRK